MKDFILATGIEEGNMDQESIYIQISSNNMDYGKTEKEYYNLIKIKYHKLIKEFLMFSHYFKNLKTRIKYK